MIFFSLLNNLFQVYSKKKNVISLLVRERMVRVVLVVAPLLAVSCIIVASYIASGEGWYLAEAVQTMHVVVDAIVVHFAGVSQDVERLVDSQRGVTNWTFWC